MSAAPSTPENASNDPLSAMTALDWIGVVLTVGAVLYLFRLATSSAELLIIFAEFGVPDGMPLLTKWVVQPRVPPTVGVCAGLLLGMAFLKNTPLLRRRMIIAGAFVLSAMFIAVWHFAATLPLVELAGNIQDS